MDLIITILSESKAVAVMAPLAAPAAMRGTHEALA